MTGIVRLRDVARVELGSQQYDQSCTLDAKPSVALCIYQLPGSNALKTAAGVYAKMKELKTRFPEDFVDYEIVYDTTPFIQESVYEVFYTLRDAVLLVAIVVLVFLQDWKAMILPMIDVPVSLIGTFAIMAAMGFTLNNLTLFGLVLAIGIVVDDAIVVLENIERLIATGLDVRTATIKAMEEITGPVLAITLVLSSVFVPCCFLGGVSGQFFRQFAVTISVSTIISAVNALTMTPSRAVVIFKGKDEGERMKDEKHSGSIHPSSLMLHPSKEALPWWIFGVFGGIGTYYAVPALFAGKVFFGLHVALPAKLDLNAALSGLPNALSSWQIWAIVSTVHSIPGMLAGLVLGRFIIRPVNAVLGFLFGGFNRWFDWMTGIYGRAVGRTLRLSAMVLAIYAGLLGMTYWQFQRTPTGFIPQQDKGYLLLNVQLPDSASVERTKNAMAIIEGLALKMPGVAHTVGLSGQSLILNANAPNLGSMYILLKPFDQRHDPKLSADEIAKSLQELCQEKVRRAIISVFGAPPIDGLGTTGGFKLIVEDRGNLGLEQLQQSSEQIVARGNETDGLRDLFNSSGANTPWLWLEIDRTKCTFHGVQVSDIFNTLQVYLGSYYVNNFNEYGRTWQVNIQADARFRRDFSAIRQLQVRNSLGEMVRLGTLLDVRDRSGPVMIMRYNMYSSAAVNADAAPGTSSGQAVSLMQDLADRPAQGLAAVDGGGVDRPGVLAAPGGKLGDVLLLSGGGLRVPGAGGPVRKLAAAAGRDPGRADVPLLLGGRPAGGRHGDQHLHADRFRGPGRPGQQECDLDRRVRQATTGTGSAAQGGDPRGMPLAAAADLDDVVRFHSRRRASGDSPGRRRRDAAGAGRRGIQRHARRDLLRHLPHARVLLRYSTLRGEKGGREDRKMRDRKI